MGPKVWWHKQKKPKHTSNMMSPTKNSNPKLPYFLVETKRLSESVDGLNSSLAHSADELWNLAEISKHIFCGILVFTKHLVFSHNFDTRNDRKPIKCSKRSDYSQVSNKNLNQKLSRWVNARNPPPKMHKPIPIVTSPTKNSKPKRPNFLIETGRLPVSIEDLNISLALSVGKLLLDKVIGTSLPLRTVVRSKKGCNRFQLKIKMH